MTAARAGGERDAVLGVVPRLVLEPATLDEAVEAMRACARDHMRIAFVGGGTDLGLGAPPAALDAVLRTGRLVRVVEHSPSDQIVTVEAGLPLAELQRVLAPHRQRLALDPPLPERATVGGLVAANAFGPRRTRAGSARDLVIGISFVRADGVLARGGGKVVKNVAGFDLPRLLVGSLGTLGLVATVTFRLHPLPEAESTTMLDGLSPGQVRTVVKELRGAQLEPSSVAALAEGGRLRLGVRFEGFAPGVRDQADRLAALGRRATLPVELLDEAAAAAFWSRHDALRSSGTFRAKLAAPPSALESVWSAALAPLLEVLPRGGAVLYPTLGIAFAAGTPADTGAVASATERARVALCGIGGSLVLVAAPADVRAGVDPWGPPPAAVAIMRQLKERLDPEGRLAPGRFLGAI